MSRQERFFYQEKDLPNLTEILSKKNLSPEELRASQAVDLLNISFKDKRILFGAFVYMKEGVFRVEELIGTSPSQVVDMRDKVITDPNYEQIWRAFNVLQRPSFLEVAAGKIQKKKHDEIAVQIGIPKFHVDEISKYLITVGVIQISPQGRANAIGFRKLVEAVKREDSKRTIDEPRQTEEELATKLSVSSGAIRRARRRIRFQNQERPLSPRFSKKPSYEKVNERRKKVLEGLKIGLSNPQISKEYQIPVRNVKDDRRWLTLRMEFPKTIYSKESNREKMRDLLNNFLSSNPPGTIINLKESHRSGAIPVSYSEFYNLYTEVAREQSVPPVRKIRRRKSVKPHTNIV